MKLFVLSVFACVATLQASPLFGVPILRPIASGFGTAFHNGIKVGEKLVGTGLGLGSAALGTVFGIGPSLGSRQGSGFVNSGDFAGQIDNGGASGVAGSEAHNVGGGSFHDNGQNHNRVTKVTTVESDGSHDIGASNFHNQGGQANSQFNENQNSAAARGNSLTEAGQGSSNVGLRGLGGIGGAAQQGSNYLNSQNFANQNQGSSAGGAAGQSAHNVGGGGYHNVGQHHTKVTSVTTNEDDGSHNVGGSNFHNVGAQAHNQFNKEHHGASAAGNSLTAAGQGSQVDGNALGNGLGLGYDVPLVREADEIGGHSGLGANAAGIGSRIANDAAAEGANATGTGIAAGNTVARDVTLGDNAAIGQI